MRCLLAVRVALCALLLGASAARAQPERERLAGERAAANARLAEQERACNERFVVTACVEAARRDHRATVARLRRAEQVLDDAKRREAAARRREEAQERAGKPARPDDAEPVPTREPRPAPHPNPPASDRTGNKGRASAAPEERRAAEARNEAAFEERARAAQARREAVERRNAERAARGKPVAPLPVPSGAAAR